MAQSNGHCIRQLETEELVLRSACTALIGYFAKASVFVHLLRGK